MQQAKKSSVVSIGKVMWTSVSGLANMVCYFIITLSIAPSSMKAGTVMKDLSVLKDKPDPIALPDEEYPEWLWSILDEPTTSISQKPSKASEGGNASGFDFQAERRKLRKRWVQVIDLN